LSREDRRATTDEFAALRALVNQIGADLFEFDFGKSIPKVNLHNYIRAMLDFVALAYLATEVFEGTISTNTNGWEVVTGATGHVANNRGKKGRMRSAVLPFLRAIAVKGSVKQVDDYNTGSFTLSLRHDARDIVCREMSLALVEHIRKRQTEKDHHNQ
jgi:hypothetical protein